MSRATLMALSGLALAAALSAQPTPIFDETLEVDVINVTVYVSDKNGAPVTGLTAEDFEVREDGKPVTVTNFYAVEDGRRAVAAPPGDPDPAGEEPLVRPSVGAMADQRLFVVVYVDQQNVAPLNRNRVLGELRRFLRQHLEAEAMVMVVTNNRALHFRTDFTSDRDRLSRTLDEIEGESGLAVHLDSERRDAYRRIQESESADEALGWARSYAESIRHDVEVSVDALRELVESLAGLQGRKALLYVSDGMPLFAGEDLFYAIERRFGESSAVVQAYTYDVARRFQELAANANADEVSFYTIDARGLTVLSSARADIGPGEELRASEHLDRIHRQNTQGSLQMLAESTGGKAIVNANRVLPDLIRIADDFRNYYSLGYTPPHGRDGRGHRIAVKVKRRGLRIRHREAYRSKPTETRMADATFSALHYRFEQNPLEVSVLFGRSAPTEDGHFEVPMTLRLPLRRIALVDHGGRREGRVRLWIAVMDDVGAVAPVRQVGVPISLPTGDAAAQELFTFPVRLTMRGGLHRLAFGVRDDLAAESSVIVRQLDVEKSQAYEPVAGVR